MSTATEVVEFKNELPVMVPKYLAEIEALKKKHEGLVLTDLNDKEQLKMIKAARIEFKNTRVGIEKFMKNVRDGANAFSKNVISKEKEIVALIQPEEDRFLGYEAQVEAEQARLAKIKAEEEEAKANDRLMELISFGFVLTAAGYSLQGCNVQIMEIRNLTDEGWTKLIEGEVKAAYDKEQARLEQVEAERLAEENRKREEAEKLEQQRQEQAQKEEEQRKCQAEIEAKKREIAEREERLKREEQQLEAAIKAEQDKKEAEARRIAEEKKREAELEQAKELAKEQERQRIEREAQEKEAKRIAEEEKAAKKAARQPDKVKLLAYLKTIPVNAPIQLKSAEAKSIHEAIDNMLNMQIDSWKAEIEKL